VAAFSTPDAEVMKFTGHERDDVNLDYMHARYYVPFAGRFLSVDPGRDWDLREPQSWNMYAYVRNNPVNNTDPDGKWCFPCLAPLVPIAVRAAPAVGRAGQRAYVYLSNPANVQRLINTGHSFVAVGVTLMESATKPGSADGDTAGKRMPKSVQEQVADEARDESGQTHCQYCGVATSEPGAEPAEGEIKGNTDHIIPASQGGNATADNAQHTCETCNKSAGANPKPKKTGARKLHEKEPGPQ
jgi:RHS repeat-associated protein